MKGNDSPLIKYGLIALAVLAVVFAISKMSGGSDEDELGEVPPPREGSPDLGPIDDKFIIGKGDSSGPKAAGK